jgi:nucleotide-binding universal stress UspA family protein
MPDMLDMLLDSARAYLSNVAARISASSSKVLTDVLVGSAASQLEDYGKEQGIDLIVMTTHGRSGIARTALGSVTDRLLGEGNAPVLVVRARPTNGH